MTTPTALILRHAVDIGPGNVATTLTERGFTVTVVDVVTTDLGEVDALASDVVVLLGGQEGAYQEAEFPYLRGELEFVRRRAAGRGPMLAICLGAQLAAHALGGRAFRGPVHEVGFVPITPTTAAVTSPVRHTAGVAMMQWHHDSFDLPPGAELLATSPDYPQAYRIGDWLLAVQFHPEVDEEIHRAWVAQWSGELAGEAGGTEEVEAVRARLEADRDAHLDAAQSASRALVGEWLDGLGLG